MFKFKPTTDKTLLVLIAITFLGGLLRFYHLSTNPPGLYVDEAGILYNAYSIAQTAKDEYGKFMPYWFESYHDFKPPVYIYLTAGLVKLFGLHDVLVRFPSAAAGTLSILLIYQLTLELCLLGKAQAHSQHLLPPQSTALITAFFFAISPWSLQFSRAGFEANLALAFILAATTLVLYSFRSGKHYYLPAGLLYLVSISTYHSARMFVPLLLLSFPIIFWREIKHRFKPLALAIAITALITLPVLPTLTDTQSLVRLSSNTYLASLPLGDAITQLGNDYLSHFDTNYLFFNGDQNGRHSVRYLGMLYYFDLPLIIIGLLTLITKFPSKPKFFLLTWLLLTPLPAAITKPNPHALRSLNILPAWIILSAIGLSVVLSFVQTRFRPRSVIRHTLYLILFLSLIYNFFLYLDEYWVRYPQITAPDWNNGYKQTVQTIKAFYGSYDTIYVHRDLPIDYLGLYLPIPPEEYQLIPQKYTNFTPPVDKFIFFDQAWTISPPPQGKILIVAPPWQKPKSLKDYRSIQMINGDDLFYIWEDRAGS